MGRPLNYFSTTAYQIIFLVGIAAYGFHTWRHPEYITLAEEIREQDKLIAEREKEYDAIARKRAEALRRQQEGYRVEDYREAKLLARAKARPE